MLSCIFPPSTQPLTEKNVQHYCLLGLQYVDVILSLSVGTGGAPVEIVVYLGTLAFVISLGAA